MATQNIVEIFRNYNIDIQIDQSSTYLIRALSEIDVSTLWVILEEFTQGQAIGMQSPNETMHRRTLCYTLIDIFENDKETISQEDVDMAYNRAAKISETLAEGSSTRPDEVENNSEEADMSNGAQRAPAVSRKRDKGLMPLIKSLVADNPKATSAEIVEMVMKQKPNAKENTVKVYYSQARKALELPSIGKRGRKPSGLYAAVKKVVQKNPDADKNDIVSEVQKEHDAKKNTINVYIGKALKELSN